MDNRICQTCKNWRQFKENKSIGKCTALGAIEFPKAEGSEIALTTDEWAQAPVTDFLAVRTEQYFGCIKWRSVD